MLAPVRDVAAWALLLAACGPAPYPAVATQAEEAAPLAYAAASSAARDVTGALRIERGGLVFAHGVTLFTRELEPRSALDAIAYGGPTYGEAAGVYADHVELRRVVNQEGGRVCGDARPGYAALLHEGERVTLLVFEGNEPPGPQASANHVCAILVYSREQAFGAGP